MGSHLLELGMQEDEGDVPGSLPIWLGGTLPFPLCQLMAHAVSELQP